MLQRLIHFHNVFGIVSGMRGVYNVDDDDMSREMEVNEYGDMRSHNVNAMELLKNLHDRLDHLDNRLDGIIMMSAMETNTISSVESESQTDEPDCRCPVNYIAHDHDVSGCSESFTGNELDNAKGTSALMGTPENWGALQTAIGNKGGKVAGTVCQYKLNAVGEESGSPEGWCNESAKSDTGKHKCKGFVHDPATKQVKFMISSVADVKAKGELAPKYQNYVWCEIDTRCPAGYIAHDLDVSGCSESFSGSRLDDAAGTSKLMGTPENWGALKTAIGPGGGLVAGTECQYKLHAVGAKSGSPEGWCNASAMSITGEHQCKGFVHDPKTKQVKYMISTVSEAKAKGKLAAKYQNYVWCEKIDKDDKDNSTLRKGCPVPV